LVVVVVVDTVDRRNPYHSLGNFLYGVDYLLVRIALRTHHLVWNAYSLLVEANPLCARSDQPKRCVVCAGPEHKGHEVAWVLQAYPHV